MLLEPGSANIDNHVVAMGRLMYLEMSQAELLRSRVASRSDVPVIVNSD